MTGKDASVIVVIESVLRVRVHQGCGSAAYSRMLIRIFEARCSSTQYQEFKALVATKNSRFGLCLAFVGSPGDGPPHDETIHEYSVNKHRSWISPGQPLLRFVFRFEWS